MKKLALAMVCAGILSQASSLRAQEKAGGAVKKDVKQTTEDAKQYIDETKEDFIKRMKAKKEELHAKIKGLEQKANDESALLDKKVRSDIHKKISGLHKREKALDKKTKQVKASGKADWHDLKSGIDKAVDDLKMAADDLEDSLKQVKISVN